MGITSIEWTERSANPIRARHKITGKIGWHCAKTSPGCAHCYAEVLNSRFGTKLPYTERSRQDIELFLDMRPIEALRRVKKPSKVFLCDMTDLFQNAVPFEWVDQIFGEMNIMKQHTFQILTKRASRMLAYFKSRSPEMVWPLPNVWLGVSVEDQKRADQRIPDLLRVPAAMRFLSVEPMLEAINLKLDYRVAIPKHREHWPTERVPNFLVICGGESGPRHKIRPFDLAWARSLRDQCQEAGVPFFMKQLGSHAFDSDAMKAVPGHAWPRCAAAYPTVDKKGGDISEWPSDLCIREFPQPMKGE